jgi:predicted AlkP superfamily pyrophosphatase or phosphodiesterase
MINDHTLARFGKLADGLLRPLHDYSFGNLAPTLHRLLTGETIGPLLPPDCFGASTYPSPRKVVLVFIDSFGWQFWQRYAETSRVMRRVIDNGVLTPISALFPSTTAASVTTLNLGTLPARHGVYEWNVYGPDMGQTIQSLPFTTLGKKPVSCVELGFDVRTMMAPDETMHERLMARGVRSIQLAHRSYARSAYNRVASAGAELVEHDTLPEALMQLEELLGTVEGKALINLYWAGLDATAHVFGPGSPRHEQEVRAFWSLLDEALAGLASPETLFLFTADHGHIGVPADQTLFVNERWPQLNGWLARSPTGETVWPNGSPRDMFLHLSPEYRNAALELLRAGLGDSAEVLTVEAALGHGLFGPAPVSDELRRRLGDVLVLPRLGHFIWWREPGLLGNTFHGHHGGLTSEELVTVLGVAQEL